jgi:alpha,alpha-trehalase
MTCRRHPIGLNQHGQHDTWEGQERFAENKRVAAQCPSEGKSLEEKRRVGAHYLAEAETGHDFNERFDHRCLDFVHTDLNGHLYEYEKFFADHGEALKWNFTIDWEARAESRKALINELLWSEERGLFLDYDTVNQRPGQVATLAGVQLLANGVASQEQAGRIVANLPLFERARGVAFSEETPNCRRYQWAFPNVWPPMARMTVEGLLRYGYQEDARRVARKFVETTENLFEKTGQLWEKTDAETGDVAGGEYDAAPMIGWTAGVYLSCLEVLRD